MSDAGGERGVSRSEMRALRFKEANEAISESNVANLEKMLGAKLPTDYRALLLATNGGIVDEENECFPLLDPRARAVFGDGFLVDHFCPVKDMEYPDGELWSIAECFRHRIPDHTLPIAKNAFGDLILLGIREPGIDLVYAWDHEHEGLAGSRRTFKNVYEFSRRFAGFVDALTMSRTI